MGGFLVVGYFKNILKEELMSMDEGHHITAVRQYYSFLHALDHVMIEKFVVRDRCDKY